MGDMTTTALIVSGIFTAIHFLVTLIVYAILINMGNYNLSESPLGKLVEEYKHNHIDLLIKK